MKKILALTLLFSSLFIPTITRADPFTSVGIDHIYPLYLVKGSPDVDAIVFLRDGMTGLNYYFQSGSDYGVLPIIADHATSPLVRIRASWMATSGRGTLHVCPSSSAFGDPRCLQKSLYVCSTAEDCRPRIADLVPSDVVTISGLTPVVTEDHTDLPAAVPTAVPDPTPLVDTHVLPLSSQETSTPTNASDCSLAFAGNFASGFSLWMLASFNIVGFGFLRLRKK